MTTEDPHFDASLAAGLAAADPAALADVWQNCRPDALRAVSALGGNAADGDAFFQAALIEYVRAWRDGQTETTPANEQIARLAAAHFRSWQQERGLQSAPQESPADESETQPEPPPDEALVETRRHIFAWKTFLQLDEHCQSEIMSQPDAPCKAQWAALLRTDEETLPEWATDAIKDTEGLQLWQAMQAQYSQTRQNSAAALNQKKGEQTRNIVLGIILCLLLYAVWDYFSRPKEPEAVFKENFTPPESFLADLNRRYETVNDTAAAAPRPEGCETLLEEIDRLYIAKQYAAAERDLLQIVQNPEWGPCHSDANFFLGVVNLKQEKPGEAIYALSKIENIELYGEDVYWYQALAIVQLAKFRPDLRERARHAVERFLENTQNEARREQAKKMIEELKE